MASVTVTDRVIWTRHVHGNMQLVDDLTNLSPGDTIELQVDGVQGVWKKMDQGRDGRPTAGLKPVGLAQAAWKATCLARKGGIVQIERVDMASHGVGEMGRAFVHVAREMSRSDDLARQSAVDALLALSGQGWRSQGRTITRDEMHES